jgi:ectoine hydroxylase
MNYPYGFTPDELLRWRDDGYVIRRRVFSSAEVERLLRDSGLAAQRCKEAAKFDKQQYFMFNNSSGSSLSIYAGLDHTGTAFEAMCRDPRLVDAAFQLFGARQYIHHCKFMNKKAFDGIAWLWHQDYGYWQTMGSIRPDMFSAMVMFDPATPDNGCLTVLPGSHKLGRLEHRDDGDTGGELMMTFLPNSTMQNVCETFKPLPLESEPGDVIFFDCNLMHCSGHNLSPRDRRAAIIAFNTDANRPDAHRHWPLAGRGVVEDILDYTTETDWKPGTRAAAACQ